MNERILVVNPGSTSTKIAVFDGENKVFSENITHSDDELAAFRSAPEQREFRTLKVTQAIEKAGYAANTFDCIMSRGGMIPPCESGAYKINKSMTDFVYAQSPEAHISNVGCLVAKTISELSNNAPAYIYDPVTVDELAPIARITGMPELPKKSRGHALNTHAMARKCAAEILHKPFEECTFIVQHLGGGCSVWLISGGKSIDMYSDDDAGFAPERSGKLQAMDLVKLCYSGKYTLEEMTKKIRGNAGLRAHLGTGDAREVESMIASGDKHADLIYDAFAYGVAKGIGDLATVVCGKVDRIILTGGIAHSDLLMSRVIPRVSWIAPVEVMAGEYEMEALAAAGLRLLRGEETAHEFVWTK